MTRSFTKREKVMLVILAVIAIVSAYYLLVWQPSTESISSAESRVVEAEANTEVELIKAAQLAEMRAELATVSGEGAESTSEIAKYDNIGNVMKVLNSVLKNTTEYDLSFQPVSFEGSAVRRTISMNFSCVGYAAAKSVVEELYGCRYRCQIGSLSLTAKSTQNVSELDISKCELSVSLSITFFEVN